MNSLVIFCVFFGLLQLVQGWNEWDYTLSWHQNGIDSPEAKSLMSQWALVWNATGSLYFGESSPPRPRRGHSLHLVKTDPRSDYGANTYIVLFGGRDNNQVKTHIPKTYQVVSVRSTITSDCIPSHRIVH